jgi:predicted TIM-barrel fold metal-dependent hydrolase
VKYALPGMNSERILWASDFPHSDGTYPYSRKVADELRTHMSETQWKQIFHDNVAELYGLAL